MKKSLPNKPSKLIAIAVKDLEKIKRKNIPISVIAYVPLKISKLDKKRYLNEIAMMDDEGK
jgi:hypothetical protein